jgi:hypothetical protein
MESSKQIVISRDIGVNSNISLRAKGLYFCIISYLTDSGFKITKKFIKSKAIEGDQGFDRAWNELKDAGYLTVDRKMGIKLH